MAWVINFFYKESKSKKKGKNIFFVFCYGEGGGWGKRFFFTKNKDLHIFGGVGVEWKG